MQEAAQARMEPASKALRTQCSANTVTASAAVAPSIASRIDSAAEANGMLAARNGK